VTYLRLPSAARSRPRSRRALDDGILAAHWLTLDEIRERQAQHRSPLVICLCIEDWLAGRRYPLELCTSIHALADVIAAARPGGRCGDSLSVCLQLRLSGRGRGELQRRAVDAGARPARRRPDAAEERERLSLAIGWLLGWAGEQTPISADRGGNFADDGVFGRMDCIDHSTTTTRLLRLLESHRLAAFHRVLEPVRAVLYLFEVHYSAQIEELERWRTSGRDWLDGAGALCRR
jgi:hypothetical protein